jgi:hypothetical protein
MAECLLLQLQLPRQPLLLLHWYQLLVLYHTQLLEILLQLLVQQSEASDLQYQRVCCQLLKVASNHRRMQRKVVAIDCQLWLLWLQVQVQ